MRSLTCDGVPLYPDAAGVYQISASRGRIEIAAYVMDYTLHIEVLDHGSVLRDDTYPITKAARLGLDIARRSAEMMGGTLTCESVYGQGSTFTLEIPQQIVDDTPLGVFSETDETAVRGPYVPQFIAPDANILVVDDDPKSRALIKGLLKATRVFVTTSKTGEDALDKIRDTHFDIVLLDILMPGTDGIAVIEHTPPEMTERPLGQEAAALTEIPADMRWLYDVPALSVDEGIRNAGGVASYLFGLVLFCNTIDGNVRTIRRAYTDSDLRLFTVKIHALRTSAHIIGARARGDGRATRGSRQGGGHRPPRVRPAGPPDRPSAQRGDPGLPRAR
ncbi:MAG: response regulator [Oscillospiraceae bacterium]|nr:response regulator [Oscillospiraceae bacterium]